MFITAYSTLRLLAQINQVCVMLRNVMLRKVGCHAKQRRVTVWQLMENSLRWCFPIQFRGRVIILIFVFVCIAQQ